MRSWLKDVQLAVRQMGLADPVLYAVTLLQGRAATWREISLDVQFPGLGNIPWSEFETAMMAKFVPASVQLQAFRSFEKLSATGTVDEYNSEFMLGMSELTNLQHVHVPDIGRLGQSYVQGLPDDIKQQMLYRVTPEHYQDLSALMELSCSVESTLENFKLRRMNLQPKGAKDAVAAQKRPREGQQGGDGKKARPDGSGRGRPASGSSHSQGRGGGSRGGRSDRGDAGGARVFPWQR